MADFEELLPYFKGSNGHLRLMLNRISKCDLPDYKESTVQGITDMQKTLAARGGYAQQDRMIKDKRRSLDRATLYSYQAALIKKQYYDFTPTMEGEKDADPVRALINPDKVKQDPCLPPVDVPSALLPPGKPLSLYLLYPPAFLLQKC